MASVNSDEALIDEISDLINDYGYKDVSEMTIGLAIERFKDLRHYPGTWESQEILDDVYANRYKVAMAAIEMDAKMGAEGQTQHTENGINRTWESRISAYKDVCGFALS